MQYREREELRLEERVIGQQLAKVRTYYHLRRRNWRVPSHLLVEVKDIVSRTGILQDGRIAKDIERYELGLLPPLPVYDDD